MTPREYAKTVEGFKRAQERVRHLLGWQISWIIAPHLKRPISPNKILGITTHDDERRFFTEVGEAAAPDEPRIILTDSH